VKEIVPDETSEYITSVEPACVEVIEVTSLANAEEMERGHVCFPVDDVCARSNGSISNHGMQVE
jgi:hypothetical protein